MDAILGLVIWGVAMWSTYNFGRDKGHDVGWKQGWDAGWTAASEVSYTEAYNAGVRDTTDDFKKETDRLNEQIALAEHLNKYHEQTIYQEDVLRLFRENSDELKRRHKSLHVDAMLDGWDNSDLVHQESEILL